MEIPLILQLFIRLNAVSLQHMVESNAVYLKDCYFGIVNDRNIRRAMQRQFRFAYIIL